MKKYFLISVWHPHKGSTEESPAYALGPYNYIADYPLEEIRPYYCYSSEKKAQRYADKLTTLYTHCKVIEIPYAALAH